MYCAGRVGIWVALEGPTGTLFYACGGLGASEGKMQEGWVRQRARYKEVGSGASTRDVPLAPQSARAFNDPGAEARRCRRVCR